MFSLFAVSLVSVDDVAKSGRRHQSRARCWVLRRSIGSEPPRGVSGRGDTDARQYCAKRCALEDALVLLNLQTGAVWLARYAKKCDASDGKPHAEKSLVTVFGQHGLGFNVRHGDSFGFRVRKM